jgi:hypothetical protein
MNPEIRFLRSLASSRPDCAALRSCPEIIETDKGYAVIGADITAIAAGKLPDGASCGDGERIVLIPRQLLIAAKRHLPDA